MAEQTNRFEAAERQAVGQACTEISAALVGRRNLIVAIVGLSVRGPRHEGDEIMIVVRGVDEDGAPVVAFHSGFSLGDALRGVAGRLNNGSLRWRADEFANK